MVEIHRYEWSSNDLADQFDVTDPATGAVTTTVQGGGVVEVDGAVRSAHAAYAGDWRWRS